MIRRAMCQYRYYYFGTCGHQQTILFDFCSDAHALDRPAGSSEEAPAISKIGKHDVCSNGGQAAGTKHGKVEGTSARYREEMLSVSPKTLTPSTHADIVSSLQAAHSTHPSESTTASHDMAGLPLFSGTFRHWMSGTSSKVPESASSTQGQVPIGSSDSVTAVSDIETTIYGDQD